jgi:hypothetical protein
MQEWKKAAIRRHLVSKMTQLIHVRKNPCSSVFGPRYEKRTKKAQAQIATFVLSVRNSWLTSGRK